jgi:multidrug resistance protein
VTPTSRRALGLIFLIVVLDLMGAGILVPVIPYIVREYRTDAVTVGWLATSFSLAQFLASPAMGLLSDRFGRRPVLLWSILGTAAGYFLFGFAQSLALLFAARILDGITGGNISTAQSYIADVTPPEDRAKSFGLIGAAFGIGFVAGPALGGALSKLSLHAPAFAAGFLSLATFFAAYFILPESLPAAHRRRAPVSLADLNPFRSLVLGFARRGLRPIFLGWFLLTLPFAGMQSNFALFTLVRFSLTPADNALLFTYLGVLATFFQGYLIRRLLPRFGERRLAIWGLALCAAGFLLIGWSPGVAFLYLAIAVTALGNSFATPSLTGLVSKQVHPGEQGLFLGVNQSVAAFTRAVGPVLAGIVFDAAGPASPYWSGAIIIAFAALLLAAAKSTT